TAYPVQSSVLQLLDRARQCKASLTDPDTEPDSAIREGRELFALLFPPQARAVIRRAHRLLISPDGPLWELPFAALVTNESGSPRYLGLEKAITYTPSLTAFAQVRAERRPVSPHRQPSAVVVGAPIFQRK